MCGYDGVVHSYVKIALGSNSDSCLSVYVCVRADFGSLNHDRM